jgi:hypothetical protein
MAAALHDIRSAPAWAPPVARFFALVPGEHPVPWAGGGPAGTGALTVARRPLSVPDGPGMVGPGTVGPALRVIPGGREAALRRRRAPHVYRRRRLGVALLVALVMSGAVAIPGALGASGAEGDSRPAVVVSTAGATTEGAAVASSTPTVTDDTPEPLTYLVQPGDTLWSIAESLDVSGDIRPVVDDLARLAGPGSLEAGTRLDLSALRGR